ncbi:hypothetical protein PGB90_008513 [Kerria lacca]
MKSINKAIFVEGIYDVVCLQEIWSLNDFKTFQRDSENKYPFSHYFHSGVFGSGVCIFSKWPIVEVLFHKWQVNGYIHKIFHGDWYGGKGVGLCRLDVNGYKVNIYTCHTHAEYSKSAEYIAHQVVQVYDTAQFIRISSENADLTILAADLNTEPGELCYRIINSYADLNDSFEVNKLELSGTYDNSRNSYRNITEGDPNGQRIDYILYKIGNNSLIKCLSYNTPLDSRIPGQNFSYSDHEAISATFQFLKQKSFGDCDGNIKCLSREKEIMDSVKEGYHICEKAARKLRSVRSLIVRSTLKKVKENLKLVSEIFDEYEREIKMLKSNNRNLALAIQNERERSKVLLQDKIAAESSYHNLLKDHEDLRNVKRVIINFDEELKNSMIPNLVKLSDDVTKFKLKSNVLRLKYENEGNTDGLFPKSSGYGNINFDESRTSLFANVNISSPIVERSEEENVETINNKNRKCKNGLRHMINLSNRQDLILILVIDIGFNLKTVSRNIVESNPVTDINYCDNSEPTDNNLNLRIEPVIGLCDVTQLLHNSSHRNSVSFIKFLKLLLYFIRLFY